jgi:hypothetical protein
MFNVLDRLRPTATGLDNLPSWFLQIGAPLLAAPVADLMNVSLDMSVVPIQWKRATILPVLNSLRLWSWSRGASRTKKIVLVLNDKVLVWTASPRVKSRLFYLFSDGTNSVHSLHFIEHNLLEMSLYLIQLQFEDLW